MSVLVVPWSQLGLDPGDTDALEVVERAGATANRVGRRAGDVASTASDGHWPT